MGSIYTCASYVIVLDRLGRVCSTCYSCSPNSWPTMAASQTQRVGIIGAGVAGLQVAAALRNAGIQVVLFEKSSNVGGVWQHNYAGYSLQVQAWHYDIPGYPWPKGTSFPYPTGQEVQLYLESYARDSNLLPYIHFNSEVVALTPQGDKGDQGWTVSYRQTGTPDTINTIKQEAVEFLVVASGLFNTPARPAWASLEALDVQAAAGFTGQVLDARDFTDAEAARGKSVVVVGGGKTAIDVAVVAGSVAVSTALVARKGHWWAPQTVLGIVPFEFAAYTRWSWALQPAWYDSSPAVKAAHAALSFVKAAVWKLLGVLFPLHTAIPSSIVPEHGLLEGVYDTIGIVPHATVAKAFKSGAVSAYKAEVTALQGNTVQLSDAKELKADIIILATGYQNKEQDLFAQPLRPLAGYANDHTSQWLYRNVLPVGLHNIAFVGLNATFQHVLTTALQARWLVAAITGELKLPSLEAQQADIEARKEWLRSSAFPFPRSNNFVWAQHGKFHNQLLADLGQPINRKGWNVVAEWFGYIKNSDFADLFPGNAKAAAVAAARAVVGSAANGAVDKKAQ